MVESRSPRMEKNIRQEQKNDKTRNSTMPKQVTIEIIIIIIIVAEWHGLKTKTYI